MSAGVPWALALALAAGLAEAALFALMRGLLHRYTHIDPRIVWTAPLSDVVLIVPAAALFTAAAGRTSERRARIMIFLAATLAAWSVITILPRIFWWARIALALGVGVQVGRMVQRRDAMARRWGWPLAFLLAGVTALAAVVQTVSPRLSERRALNALPAADAGRPNVLLLILDTVRALDLELYGYARHTMPNLAAFAARGITFDHAIAAAPWTLPSHAVMFTGIDAAALSADWLVPLDGGAPTLADVLARRGYHTAGFVANVEYTSRESGLARGFAHYEDFAITPLSVALAGGVGRTVAGWHWLRQSLHWYEPLTRKNASRMDRDLLAWLARPRERPFFAFVNYYDAHNPYLPPPPFDTAFGARKGSDSARNLTLANDDSMSVGDAAVEHDAYDAALLALDHGLGALFDSLQARGLLRTTLVIVTADHGEEFAEHGLLSHGASLYPPALLVPLVMALPGRLPAGSRDSTPVSLRDLPATILDIAGITRALPGRSFAHAGGAPTDTIRASVRQASGAPRWQPVARGNLDGLLRDGLWEIHVPGRPPAWFDLLRDPAGAAVAAPVRLPNGR